jgi:hypothetical protein
VAIYTKKNREDQFIVMREGHQGEHALVCCACGTLLIAGPLSARKGGTPCPRAGCESHYYTERAPAGDSVLVGVLVRHR